MAGKKTITLIDADGSEVPYEIGLLTFDQEQEVLASDPPLSLAAQEAKLVQYGAGIENVGAVPALHVHKLRQEILKLNEYSTKGGETSTGEAPTTIPSAPS